MAVWFCVWHRNVSAEKIVQQKFMLRLVGGAYVVILIPVDRIKSMTNLARQLCRPVAEEAVAGISLEMNPRSLAGIGGAPLMDVVTGGTGHFPGSDDLARGGIEEGEERPVVTG